MRVVIWGCRGSVPTPGPTTVRCGGNTSCVEVSLEDGSVFVLDAGTGIRELGAQLAERGTRRIHLLLTHLHLDHLEGLRFFAPLFDPGVEIDLWGPRSPVLGLKERIRRSFSPPLFPIDLQDTPAKVNFYDVPSTPWRIGDALLTASLVVHPGPTVGFRIDADGASVAYLPDHEPALTGAVRGAHARLDLGRLDRGGRRPAPARRAVLRGGVRRAPGWGHSSVSSAVAYAEAVGAKRLVLFHHDPTHSDETMQRLEAEARSLADDGEDPPTIAREGMVLDL